MGFADPSFKNIKAGQPNFIIWRVVDFELKLVPPSSHGSFYEGDSYIIFSAAPPAEKLYQLKKGTNGKLEYHIHMWLGKATTIDESTTAAIKTVELDEILGGITIHHREVQGFESNRFMSYFKTGIRILKGDTSSGLRHVSDNFTPRLFKIKGRRRPVLTEQPSVHWEYFNSGDVFILETKNKIFIWTGKESNKMEVFQAGKVAAQLRSEGPNRSIIIVEEDKENDLPEDDLLEFKDQLPLSDKIVNPAHSDKTDTQIETEFGKEIKLYAFQQSADFELNTEFVKNGPLSQADLNSTESFLVDNNEYGVWVWIGKKETGKVRTTGVAKAYEFIQKKGSPSSNVTRVVDGAEPIEFQMLFTDWKDPNTSIGFGQQISGNNIAKTVNMCFDAAKLHETPALAANTQLVDDGNGTTEVWRLNNKDLEPVVADDFGQFFSGDCYLIHYMYELNGKKNHILYYWLGAHSSIDERGTIAWHTVQKDEELKGAAVQVRVVQSKEPPHFLMIFKGKMIIFDGGYASSFDGPEGKNRGIASQFLIQVTGGEEHTTQSVQVTFSASSLNSNDVFVLRTEKKTYLWCGKGSTGDERERAKIIAEHWSKTKDFQVLFEGQEEGDFWELLGGQKPYANNERLANPDFAVPARLFHCSNATGYFKAEEIVEFSQQDLIPEDVMVLDIGKAIFIWIGVDANKTERTEAPKLVEEYLKTDPRGRDLDTPVITIQQGHEPPNFTGFFGAWDTELWEGPEYKSLLFGDQQNNTSTPSFGKSGQITKYPLSVLLNTADKLPEDVDVMHKELHLHDDDFFKTFGINRKEYDALPVWKQNNLKKAAGLF